MWASFSHYVDMFDLAAGEIESTVTGDFHPAITRKKITNNQDKTRHTETQDLFNTDVNANNARSFRSVVDATPFTLFDPQRWPVYAGNEGKTEPDVTPLHIIKAAAPDVKIIICLRNPTDRYVAALPHAIKTALTTTPGNS